jgi:hypothetical protein
MKTLPILALIAAAVAVLPLNAQTMRIGTFHKGSIVVAYYRSPMWAEVLKSKMDQMQQAKAANDTKKVQELERWGQSHQETAHQQLEGDAPIYEIIEALKPSFPEIAKKAEVSVIVLDLPFAGADVEKVDVTDLLLDWLKADSRTRSIVKGLRK